MNPPVTARLVWTFLRHPYLTGLVSAPLLVGVLKPLVRATVKTAVALGLETRKLAAEARAKAHEEYRDLSTEASTHVVAKTTRSSNPWRADHPPPVRIGSGRSSESA